MTLELFLSAALPSLCVSVIMMIFSRRQSKRDAKAQLLEDMKKNSEQVQLDLMLATAKLSYAVAMAMKNGHPNGEVEEGVEQYKNAMRSFKKFERELIVENGGTSHDV